MKTTALATVVVCISLLLNLAGCRNERHSAFSPCSVECERLQLIRTSYEMNKFKMVAFFGEDSNEPVEMGPYNDFAGAIFSIVGCCFSNPHPVASEWIEYNRLECIRQYLENESVQRIAFCTNVMEDDTERPENWGKPWAEITEPKQIKEVLTLLYNAMDNEKDRFANETAVASDLARIQIITDKHKFLIQFSTLGIDRGRPICGVGWTAYGLKEKLKQWGFSR